MSGLLVKDLSRDLHKKLKARAAASGRSVSSEVLTILETALQDDASGPLSVAEVNRLRVRGRRPLTRNVLERARRRDR